MSVPVVVSGSLCIGKGSVAGLGISFGIRKIQNSSIRANEIAPKIIDDEANSFIHRGSVLSVDVASLQTPNNFAAKYGQLADRR